MANTNPTRPELGGVPPANNVRLRAGPLTMIFDHGDLRYITFRKREVVRRVYAAVRDRNWGTILGTLSNLKIDSGRDFFEISYDSEHLHGDISFVWHAEISGDPNGTIRFTFDGEARSTFLKNRIGLCVLHPMEFAGSPVKLMRADGSKLEAQFPKLVAQEQPIKDVHDLRSLSHSIAPDAWLEFHFEGDLFETEDQRNWIDASFKTYSTPQRLPIPVEIQRGTRIQQSVTIKLGGQVETEPVEVSGNEPVILTIDTALGKSRGLPALGFGVSSFGETYRPKTVERLKALRPSHLRVDVDLSNIGNAFDHALHEAESLNAPLQVALTIPPDADGNVAREHHWEWIRKRAKENLPLIKEWIVLSANSRSTTEASFAAAKLHLNGFGPIGVGTNGDFYQLNQQRPPWERAFFIAWSMNPQVHAFDDFSISETPEALPSQIESAREYFPGKPLHISPITLKPRFNPVATGAEAANRAGELPLDVDPRQSSFSAATWTLGMLRKLGGAHSVTFFETVGWRGIVEREGGAPLPKYFPSVPGGVYPVYYIFRWIADLAGARIMESNLSHPRRIAALPIMFKKKLRLILGNLTATDQPVQVQGLGQIKRTLHSFPLDKGTLPFLMTEPEQVLESWQELDANYVHSFRLHPREIVCIDLEVRA